MQAALIHMSKDSDRCVRRELHTCLLFRRNSGAAEAAGGALIELMKHLERCISTCRHVGRRGIDAGV